MSKRLEHFVSSPPARRCWGIAALCIAPALLIGCVGPVPPHAAKMLTDAQAAYQAGNDAAVIERTDRFLSEFAKSQEAAEALYLRGLSKWRQNDLPAAQEDLTKAIEGTRRGDLAGRAELALGMMAEARGDDPQAESFYRRSLAAMGETAAPADEALFRLGCCLQRQGQWRPADLQFDRLAYRFPDSTFRPQASQRIRARAWTVQAGQFEKRENAEQLEQRLHAADLPGIVVPVMAPAVLQAVQVGRYGTYTEAVTHLPAVQAVAEGAVVTVAR